MTSESKSPLNWDLGERKIPVGDWKNEFGWVEEFQASPDGEKVAAVVNIDEGEFNICVNGQAFEIVVTVFTGDVTPNALPSTTLTVTPSTVAEGMSSAG